MLVEKTRVTSNLFGFDEIKTESNTDNTLIFE